MKAALRTEQKTKKTFVAVSDIEGSEDDYSVVPPLAASITHAKVIREAPKPRSQNQGERLECARHHQRCYQSPNQQRRCTLKDRNGRAETCTQSTSQGQ